mmetsp:Transcript_110769/g.320068  ORF Transcript_110769/g.320068 Transcript_110769/m.320068 type:complete len:557 (+) Transcript_110769:387-2057(+)
MAAASHPSHQASCLELSSGTVNALSNSLSSSGDPCSTTCRMMWVSPCSLTRNCSHHEEMCSNVLECLSKVTFASFRSDVAAVWACSDHATSFSRTSATQQCMRSVAWHTSSAPALPAKPCRSSARRSSNLASRPSSASPSRASCSVKMLKRSSPASNSESCSEISEMRASLFANAFSARPLWASTFSQTTRNSAKRCCSAEDIPACKRSATSEASRRTSATSEAIRSSSLASAPCKASTVATAPSAESSSVSLATSSRTAPLSARACSRRAQLPWSSAAWSATFCASPGHFRSSASCLESCAECSISCRSTTWMPASCLSMPSCKASNFSRHFLSSASCRASATLKDFTGCCAVLSLPTRRKSCNSSACCSRRRCKHSALSDKASSAFRASAASAFNAARNSSMYSSTWVLRAPFSARSASAAAASCCNSSCKLRRAKAISSEIHDVICDIPFSTNASVSTRSSAWIASAIWWMRSSRAWVPPVGLGMMEGLPQLSRLQASTSPERPPTLEVDKRLQRPLLDDVFTEAAPSAEAPVAPSVATPGEGGLRRRRKGVL